MGSVVEAWIAPIVGRVRDWEISNVGGTETGVGVGGTGNGADAVAAVEVEAGAIADGVTVGVAAAEIGETAAVGATQAAGIGVVARGGVADREGVAAQEIRALVRRAETAGMAAGVNTADVAGIAA